MVSIAQELHGLQPIEYAYFAGLFDGEGCVMLAKATYNNGNVYYKPRITLTGCYYPTLSLLEKKYKGHIYIKTNTKDESKKTCYAFSLNGIKSISFLKSLLPYLKEKRTQALLLIESEKYPAKSSQRARIYQKLRDSKKVSHGPS
tara:strand:- start:216 stop:650 length:435 start_codon:yes stop_codon:yes gene_type:complete